MITELYHIDLINLDLELTSFKTIRWNFQYIFKQFFSVKKRKEVRKEGKKRQAFDRQSKGPGVVTQRSGSVPFFHRKKLFKNLSFHSSRLYLSIPNSNLCCFSSLLIPSFFDNINNFEILDEKKHLPQKG